MTRGDTGHKCFQNILILYDGLDHDEHASLYMADALGCTTHIRSVSSRR